MDVELFYFDGCPGFEQLLPRVRELAAGRAEVRLRAVTSPEAAEAVGFLGSPTLRVDGRDVEPGADGRTDFGLKCRLYRQADVQTRTPPEEWILRALGAAS